MPLTELHSRCCSATAVRAQYNTLPATWRLLAASRVAEFDIEAVVLEHCRTRAQYLHLAAADANNAFNVSFRRASFLVIPLLFYHVLVQVF